MYNITLAINRQGSQVRSVAIKPVKLTNPTVPTGIVSLSNTADLKLFPNPNNGKFELVINGVSGEQDGRLEITNILGELVYSGPVYISSGSIQQQIDLTTVRSGTYFVRIATSNKVYNTRIVISK
jgi:hypothetical protein